VSDLQESVHNVFSGESPGKQSPDQLFDGAVSKGVVKKLTFGEKNLSHLHHEAVRERLRGDIATWQEGTLALHLCMEITSPLRCMCMDITSLALEAARQLILNQRRRLHRSSLDR
jgi:hypothetical protein